MSNKELAKLFNQFANLLEIHDGNDFKIRSYKNAYNAIRNQPQKLYGLTAEQLIKTPSLGKSLTAKISELNETGQIQELQDLIDQTPEDVRKMFKIRGLGAKKVKLLWREHSFENLGDLLQACRENRLIEIKGFGPKMQETIQKGIEFFHASEGKYLISHGHDIADRIIEAMESFDIPMMKSGDLLTLEVIIDRLELITDVDLDDLWETGILTPVEVEGPCAEALFEGEYKLTVIGNVDSPGHYLTDEYGPQFHQIKVVNDEWGVEPRFSIPAEIWNHPHQKEINIDALVDWKDIRGVIHNHTRYSDGAHTVLEMAKACIEKGYDYLVVSDHSKSAFYANGLSEERVIQQWAEIDHVNNILDNLHIYKSIESDILNDGSLDYEEDILKGFDLVIASVHSQLQMDEEKATARLIKAVENQYTRILGHPTGRLLLGREGYPIDHKKIIDACAANNVVVELNANPHRLDLDWKYITYAESKGVMIAINPDAHHVDGIDDIRYGVMAARKGGLTKENCLNTLDKKSFDAWLQ